MNSTNPSNEAPFHDGELHRCVSPLMSASSPTVTCGFSPRSVAGMIPAGEELVQNLDNIAIEDCTFKHRDDEALIYHLNENDVLCGRGKGPNNHLGNRRFRELVNGHRATYLASSNRREKGRICESIIEKVQNANPPGRFLIKSLQKGKAGWKIIEYRKAMLKTGQALREGVTKEMIGKIHDRIGADTISSLSLLKRTGILEPKMRLPEKSLDGLEVAWLLLALSQTSDGISTRKNNTMPQEPLLEGKKMTPKGRLMERAGRAESLSEC